MTDTTQPEKMPLTSLNISAEKREQLRQCIATAFPEVMAEEKIDLDQLRRVLGEWVEPDRERFGLSWPGKAACMKVIQAPSVGTLKPCPEESVEWDTTENVFIEGDNLEVLKLLQKAYFGKIKMIYIDPPYNTGKEFIYPDKYSETLETYLEYTGQKDADGRRFSTNTDSSGRFHSRWLNMMYPRIYLAKNLLKHDGIIFVSIDDHEQDNTKKILDEIFGEENFISCIVWEKIYTTKNDSTMISGCHDYILVYAKNIAECNFGLLPRTEEMDARYTNPDNDPRGAWKPIPLYADGERKNGRFVIEGPTGRRFEPQRESHWRYIEADVQKLIADNRVSFGKDGSSQPNLKRFLSELREGVKSKTIWFHKDVGSNDTANREIKSLFGDDGVFSFPKPATLVRRMLQLGAIDQDAIVLDFFAGSGTTAEAVILQNAEDGGRRKFILVQLPEITGRADYPTIAAIARERIRRVAKRVHQDLGTSLDLSETSKCDVGFRGFRLDRSAFRVWDGESVDQEALEGQLALHADHVAKDASQDEILYELLLKDGFSLATPMKNLKVAGKQVFSVAGDALLICLDKQLTQEVIDAMADMEPARVICLDAGFQGNDQLKANAVQTFKARARNRETAIEFRTV
jgi:adenine-specific DNA-methyltransferase